MCGAVEALREIGEQLGKKDWNFGIDPCIKDTSWLTPLPSKSGEHFPLYNNSVVCICSKPEDGVCHIEKM
jgi:hypothetical protein